MDDQCGLADALALIPHNSIETRGCFVNLPISHAAQTVLTAWRSSSQLRSVITCSFSVEADS